MISRNHTLSENFRIVCSSLGYDACDNSSTQQIPAFCVSGEEVPYEEAYVYVLDKLELEAEPEFNSLFSRFQKNYETFAGDNLNVPELTAFFIDWFRNIQEEGFSGKEYFHYELFCKEAEERRTFLNRRDRVTLKKTNEPLQFSYFGNRAIFNEHYSRFATREWVNGASRGKREIDAFIEKHPVFFVKASSPEFKYRPAIIDSRSFAENVLFELMHYKGLLAETIVEQHEQLASIYPTSLNTVRAAVQSDGQTAKVMAASASFGKDGDVFDTFNRTGLCASIDVESGMIDSPLVDKNNNVYERHPDTNVPIKGMVYPAWDKICEVVCEAMLDFPELANAGWDVAVRKDGGVELLGAVTGNNFTTMQMPNQKGIRHLYEDMLE